MRKLKNNEITRKNIEEFKKSEKTPIIIILDNIRSALNVGSVFRCADAFLIEKIILCGITAKPPSKEIRKSALGSTTSVEWEYYTNTLDAIKKLKKTNIPVIGVEQTQDSISLEKIKLQSVPIAIVMGNEINGVDQEVLNLCDYTLEIPQFGIKHSLNISTATGIVVWELWKKIKL
jgi:tRNA G18 (ribose-2'-O)-methylase SpoU